MSQGKHLQSAELYESCCLKAVQPHISEVPVLIAKRKLLIQGVLLMPPFLLCIFIRILSFKFKNIMLKVALWYLVLLVLKELEASNLYKITQNCVLDILFHVQMLDIGWWSQSQWDCSVIFLYTMENFKLQANGKKNQLDFWCKVTWYSQTKTFQNWFV